jgi:hypothetical protein
VAEFNDLYSEDQGIADNASQRLIDAMRRRRAGGTVASIIGGPFARAGQSFLGDADQTQAQLLAAAMAGSRNRLDRQRVDAYAPDFEAQSADRAARLDLQRENLGLQRQRLLQPKPVKEPKPVDTSKMNLGEYLTPATSSMTDAQRNDLMNTLAVPGSQWLDQMAELAAVLEDAGSAPTATQLSDIQRLIATALVKQNKVAGLGALSGEDVNILKKAGGSVGDLTNWLGQATGLRDLKASVRSAAQRGAKDIEKAAGAYGSKPVPGAALDFNQFDARVGEYRYKGGKAKPEPTAAGGLTPPRADGKVRVKRNGTPGWVTTPLPGDERI